jgi:hypothetical protein
VTLTSNSAVHDPIDAARIGVQRTGASGVVTGGPQIYQRNTWWRVDFSSGEDGWVRDFAMETP